MLAAVAAIAAVVPSVYGAPGINTPPTFVPMAALARGIVADNIAINVEPAKAASKYPYTPRDMNLWRAMGFTYVRIPVDVCHMLPGLPLYPSSPTRLSTAKTVSDALSYLDSKVQQFIESGFLVVVCVFVSDRDLRSKKAADGTFDQMLKDASAVMPRRYGGRYDQTRIMFEIYNEPLYNDSGPGFMFADWNALHPQLVRIIRAIAPKHTLIMDGPRFAKAEFISNLAPSTDTNVIYSFHFYDPPQLTQQGAGGGRDATFIYPRPATKDGSANWPKEWDKSKVAARIRMAIDWAKGDNRARRPLPLICGEFGCTGAPDYASRLRWVTDVRDVLSTAGIPLCWWSEKGKAFGLNPIGKPTENHNVLDANSASAAFGYDVDLVRILTYPYK